MVVASVIRREIFVVFNCELGNGIVGSYAPYRGVLRIIQLLHF